MINFDLPWDPMQLEQRIGRIQRLGGAPKVFIWNLYLKGTIEEDILSILDSKIQMFGETIGEVEQIIGGLDKGDSFDNQMLDLYLADPESEVELKELEKQRNELFSPGRRQTSTAAKLLGGVFTDQEVTATTGDQRETTRPRATDPPSDDLQRLGTSSSPSMRCVACNEPIDPDAECCTNCGEEQTPAELDFEQLQARSLESSVSPTADDSVPMTACPHCQRLQPMDRSACENCGQKLDTPLEKTTDDSDAWDDATNPPGNGFHCVHCGASVDAGAECCTECGEPLA
jgi:RNA polymerase subunit RPABC4/transcription elongation factor Spt4